MTEHTKKLLEFLKKGDYRRERIRGEIDVSAEALSVYRSITSEPIHIDSITSAVGLPVRTVLQALTELELEGLIKAEKGRMYHII